MPPTTAPAPKTKALTSTAPAPVLEQPAVPPTKATLDAVLARVVEARHRGIEAALVAYRSLALKLADGGELSVAEAEAAVHAFQVLHLEPEAFRKDVEAIIGYRTQRRHAEQEQKIAAELAPQEAGWVKEMEAMRRREREIATMRNRIVSSTMQAGRHTGEAQRLYGEHRRVLAPLVEALELETAPKARVPRIQRSNPVDNVPVVRNEPAGVNLGVLG